MRRSARNGVYVYGVGVLVFTALEVWIPSWYGAPLLAWALISLAYWVWRDHRERTKVRVH
jgi:hypothetical protein